MKTLHQLVLLATLLLGGCLKDDFGECSKMQSVVINFRYQQAEIDVFKKNISRVHLFVFDQQDGHFILSKQIDQSSLNKFQGAELDLPKGQYQIVCWGNVYQNSEFCSLNQTSHLNDPSETYLLDANSNTAGGYTDNGDQLYYAPYCDSKSFLITVDDLSEKEYTIDFRTAHTTIDIYVTGYTDMDDPAANGLPSIELTNITPKYDFQLNEFGEPITYKQTTHKEYIEGIETRMASFHIPLLERNKDIKIVLRKQLTNQLLETVNLDDFVNEHYSKIDFLSPQTVNLKIEFRYINGQISISIPTWGNEVITPEI